MTDDSITIIQLSPCCDVSSRSSFIYGVKILKDIHKIWKGIQKHLLLFNIICMILQLNLDSPAFETVYYIKKEMFVGL